MGLSGFSKLTRKERFQRLFELGLLSRADMRLLNTSSFMEIDLAEEFIENSVGYFPMPMGVVTHLVVDEIPVIVPMAVEETSIIAAASKTAKWIKSKGGRIRTSRKTHEGIGQVQFAELSDPESFIKKVNSKSSEWTEECNVTVSKNLNARGGGVQRFEARVLDRADGGKMGVVHIYVDTCEAMGANIINQIAEYMKDTLEADLEETPSICILSNLVDTNVTSVKVELEGIDKDLGIRIQEASIFAETDPYRAATNNKGIMNAIDAVLIATGNDWRAVEAGVHAYAAQSGKYTSLSQWRYKDGVLTGTMKIPLAVGTVGGVTRLHPFAQLSLKLMQTKGVDRLCSVVASIGLVQNLGALRALTTEGIIEGHMKLHIKNLTLSAGAKENEAPLVQEKLEEILKSTKRVSLSQAVDVLAEIRQFDVNQEKSHEGQAYSPK